MSQNGKGSAQRRQTKDERKRFEDNYDSIFGQHTVRPNGAGVYQGLCGRCGQVLDAMAPGPCRVRRKNNRLNTYS